MTSMQPTRRAPLAAAALALALVAAPASAAPVRHDPEPPAQPTVDLALCLDTSGSMNGLIDSAKEKLWAIVNELGRAEPTPRLRVALLTYGNNGHAEDAGWVSLDVPLTTDLDLVSQRLFGLGTNGGTEYVGRVLQRALTDLDWSDGDGLRVLVVAGNESADQDPVQRAHDVARQARLQGFHLNSIFCDNGEPGMAPGWEDVALLGSGTFAIIDQDKGTLTIDTPYDGELAKLNAALNETYIPFGAQGAAGQQNQVLQDGNAASMNTASLADRVVSKAGGLYQCAWDLVDACDNGQVKLEDVPAAELPAPLQSLSLEARRAHLGKLGKQRAELKLEIEQVSVQRQAHLAGVRSERSLDDSSAFDRVLRDAVRSQALGAGFRFPTPAPAAVKPAMLDAGVAAVPTPSP